MGMFIVTTLENEMNVFKRQLCEDFGGKGYCSRCDQVVECQKAIDKQRLILRDTP